MKSTVLILLTFLFTDCSLTSPCGKDKDQFLYNFHKFVKDVKAQELDYADETWEDLDLQYAKFTKECYAQYKEEMSRIDKEEYYENTIAYNTTKYGDGLIGKFAEEGTIVLEKILEGVGEWAETDGKELGENLEQWMDNEGADIGKKIERWAETEGKDIERKIEEWMDTEGKDIEEKIERWAETDGKVLQEKIEEWVENDGKRLGEEINRWIEEDGKELGAQLEDVFKELERSIDKEKIEDFFEGLKDIFEDIEINVEEEVGRKL